jgi:predicted ATPase
VALERGLLPVHAAAFAWHEHTTLLVGASGAGKTALLLAALLSGATLVAAEWVYICGPENTPGGGEDALRVRPWHLASLPELCGLLRPDETRQLQRRIPHVTFVRRLPHIVTRALPAVARLERRWFVDLAASRFMSTDTRPRPVAHIVFVRANQPVFHVQPFAKAEAQACLLAIAAADDAALGALARTFATHHPMVRPNRVETCSEARSAAVERLLHNAETVTVDLPQHGLGAATAHWLQSVCRNGSGRL